MPRIAYMVIATLPDAIMAEQYIAWLKDGHIAAVIKGGAQTGEIIRLDSDTSRAPVRIMSSYTFASRGNFDRYVKDTAPRLRAEGLEKFGSERGVAYQRFTGELLAEAASA